VVSSVADVIAPVIARLPPAMLPLDVILPVALTIPLVSRFPPVMFPLTTAPVDTKLDVAMTLAP